MIVDREELMRYNSKYSDLILKGLQKEIQLKGFNFHFLKLKLEK